MQCKGSFLYNLRHNDKLAIRIVGRDFGHLTPEEASAYEAPHHLPYYYFLFMMEGSSKHTVDLNTYEVANNELIFVTPHQVHDLPVVEQGANFIKLGFDDTCLSLLPKPFTFLLDPLHQQKVSFDLAVAGRVKIIFNTLSELLRNRFTEPELILAHLNSLLTEINLSYLKSGQVCVHDKLSTYTAFKALIEKDLTEQPGIARIAEELGISNNVLYQVVKQYSGLSPKAYVTQRLILEARRRLYYVERSSVKELAFALGFNDPEYFSRMFRKVTGQTIAQFVQDLSGI